MNSNTREMGWSLVVNIMKNNSYSYTLCCWGGCCGGQHEKMTCIVMFCMTAYWILYLFIYISVASYPMIFLPCEGIKIYSERQAVDAKLKNSVLWWGKKHWQTDYRLGIWPWYYSTQWTDVLILKFRPGSFLETLDTKCYDILWYDIFNCNWFATRWQQYSTHLHTNNT
jgi:hypothetical protein